MIISPAYASETAHAAGHGSMFQDPTFWVALAFCLTILFLYKAAGKSISNALQARADSIEKKLTDASNLRSDAQKLFESYQANLNNSKSEVDNILNQARIGADQLKATMEADFAAKLNNKEAVAATRLKRAADEASEEVRNAAITLTMQSVERILSEKLNNEAGKKLIRNAIDSLPQILSKKDI